MRNSICLLFTILTLSIAHGQEKSFEKEVSKISRKIERTVQKEKSFLKEKVTKIQADQDANAITKEEADAQKEAAATYHANQIETKVTALKAELETLVEEKANSEVEHTPNFDETPEEGKVTITAFEDTYSFNFCNSNKSYSKRTTSQFVVIYGINNVITDHQISSFDKSEYKFWGSHFWEVGWSFKTRLSKDASKAYIKYGGSFVWNNLKPKDNQYHVMYGDQTVLEVHPMHTSVSKLRNIQFIVPIHFELDFSKNHITEDGTKKDRTNKAMRIGIGGYGGFRLKTYQMVNYKNNEGYDVEEKHHDDFNIGNFTYGVSSYIAYQSFGVYTKYDLAPLFSGTKTRNVSIGLRFDIN